MKYPFPDTIRHLIDERMKSGDYTSEDEILVQALRSLKEHDEAIADIREGLDDEAAGRIRSLGEFDAESRQSLGFAT
ncbi:MAG: hypothetical protein KJ000_17070 [Pirellulaceae bacterium]|nr:hypothetical protein [Pirellulaceae bacterium]